MNKVPTAYEGELMLAGWSDSHTAGAKVTFWLPDQESLECFRHLTVRKGNAAGQRFMAVLVELDDEGQPINNAIYSFSNPTERTRHAAILCKSVEFQQYAANRILPTGVEYTAEEQAANYLRQKCDIESRTQLATDDAAWKRFMQIEADFRSWFHG